jgi:hypothetical protein
VSRNHSIQSIEPGEGDVKRRCRGQLFCTQPAGTPCRSCETPFLSDSRFEVLGGATGCNGAVTFLGPWHSARFHHFILVKKGPLKRALFLLQKTIFSFSDSHAFNRADGAYPQVLQQEYNLRWNLSRKWRSSSLDLPRLHAAPIFVLLASVSSRFVRKLGYAIPAYFD